MTRGRKICRALREIRKRVADANGIPYEIEECRHEGPCSGTCPKCEAEARLIEEALADMERRGLTVVREEMMSEEELLELAGSLEPAPERDPNVLGGMPEFPYKHREEMLEMKIAYAVMRCMEMSSVYPDASLYIGETDLDVLCVPRPALEQEALMDYLRYDWRSLVKDGAPCDEAIHSLAGELLNPTPVLCGDIVPNPDEPEPDDDDDEPETPVGKVLTSITVAGTSYVKDMEELAERIYPGKVLQVRRDRDNQHDSHAIALYLDNRRVGYVPRDKNEILANLLDASVPLLALVTSAEWHSSWFHITASITLTP